MIIKDCVYRFIEVPDVCKRIIDTFEFQRLRFIKQLGFVHMVYPSAVHTRFEHSLGVMYLAGKVVDVLRQNGIEISDREKELVQVAGLLHDSGHVAFSHLIDYILIEEGVSERHEERSIQILNIINKRLKLFDHHEVSMIQRMILGQTDNEKKFLYEIVCNKSCGIDVDRLDYLQRDAYHTGIPGFQPDYLVKCYRVKNDRLAFLSKSTSEIRLMFETRRRMFNLVYRHKTVLQIEVFVRKMIKSQNIIQNWKKGNINWLYFDDSELLKMLVYCPEFNNIYTRNWERVDIKSQKYNHCTEISDKEIENQMENINFV